MPKRSDAKAEMITAAAKLFRAHGYEGVGIAELLTASGAPRGSLYFHFPGGKEEIAAEAILRAGEFISSRLQGLAERVKDPKGYIDRAFAAWGEELSASDFQNGCAVALIALEMAERSPRLRDAAAEAFALWEKEFAIAARAWGMREGDAVSFASAMLGAIEGAIALARTKRSIQPFQSAALAMNALAETLIAKSQ
ncbi:MAG: TetR/AcrR family transcriptional regulator [Hyphomonadaceae bacterium]|nr:TetR/AcrR family transcriptional regulator [Hyphomonadaceae bacterium]